MTSSLTHECGGRCRYRPVLLAVATASASTLENPAELWSAMQGMKTDIISLLQDGNDGVRTSVLKFLELLVSAGLSWSDRCPHAPARDTA